jgi:hypothetical protein
MGEWQIGQIGRFGRFGQTGHEIIGERMGYLRVMAQHPEYSSAGNDTAFPLRTWCVAGDDTASGISLSGK